MPTPRELCRNRSSLSRRRWALAGLCGLAVCAAGSGCSEETPLERAVAQSDVDLRTFGDRGAQSTYLSVLAQLQGAGGGSESAEMAAAVRKAIAQLGTGTGQIGEASRLARGFTSFSTELRAAISAWSDQSARAEAADSFDPSPQIAELREQARTRDGEIRDLQSQRGELAERMASLEGRVETLLGRAQQTRAEAGEMRLRSAQVSAQRAAEMAVAIRELTREADGLEREALGLQGQAEMLQPRLDELAALIDQREQQNAVIAEAIDALTARAATERSRANEYRESAAEIAMTIRARAEEARAYFDDEVTPAFEAAAGTLGRASSEARRAANESSAARLTQGMAERRLGELALMRARAHDDAARLFAGLASAQPALPDQRAFGEAAGRYESAAAEQRALASEKFRAAVGVLRGLRVTGEAREALNQMTESLESLVAEAEPAEGASPAMEGDAFEDESVEGDSVEGDEQP